MDIRPVGGWRRRARDRHAAAERAAAERWHLSERERAVQALLG